jgi:serine/threonine protein kinase
MSMIWNVPSEEPAGHDLLELIEQGRLRQLGPYHLLERIGQGGMASVYKARHRGTGGLVALKIVSADVLGDPVLCQRFEQEFRAARHLDHPHIVKALDFGWEDSLPYLVTELVEGPSLGQRLASAWRLPEEEALGIAVPVARALHAAHRRGILHRDVKPDNILLAADGRVKLADLGLAKDLGAGLALTRSAAALGTPTFMPPEQFTDARHVDARCDIYGLGATLYLAVTGVVPFQARGQIATLRKKLANDIVPPRQLVPGLRERVDRAVLRALRAERGQRPASCLEFIEQLTGRPLAADAEAAAAERTLSLRQLRGLQRRASVRHPCPPATAGSLLLADGAQALETRVVNLSRGGIGLLLCRPLERDTPVLLRLENRLRGLTCALAGRVVHAQEQAQGEWLVGCAFSRGLSPQELAAWVDEDRRG